MEEGNFEEKGGVGEIAARVKDIGIVKIILALIVLVIVMWFFFFRASPATISLSFVERDSTIDVSGVIVEVTQDGRKAQACVLPFLLCQDASSFTASGSRVEMVLPAGDVQLSILPPPKYDRETILITVQGSQGQTIELSRKSSATLSGPSHVTVGAECTLRTQFVLKNTGTEALSGSFTVEPEEKMPFFSFPAASVQADSEQQLNVDVRGSKAKDEFEAVLRIKGTSIEAPIAVSVVEKAQLQVYPSDFSCNAYPCFIPVTVRNTGQVRAEDVKVAFSPEIADVASVSALDRTTIEPNEELKFGVEIADTAQRFGKVTISSQCPPSTDIGVTLNRPA